MKSLDIIQIVNKTGKILSQIVLTISLIGMFACMVGLLILKYGDFKVIEIGNITIHGFLSDLQSSQNISEILFCWMIFCSCEFVLGKCAVRYFENVIVAGTPFTFCGAKELFRLGALCIAVPNIANVLLLIMNIKNEMCFFGNTTMILGVMFLLGSILCRYGSEIFHK